MKKVVNLSDKLYDIFIKDLKEILSKIKKFRDTRKPDDTKEVYSNFVNEIEKDIDSLQRRASFLSPGLRQELIKKKLRDLRRNIKERIS